MKLSDNDAHLFYELWLPLLDFVNKKRHVVSVNIQDQVDALMLDPEDARAVAASLWDNVSIIDTYLKKHPELPEDHQNILRSWKRRKQGIFFMERHLKKGTIFISVDDDQVYQVHGIVSSWSEMFEGFQLPLAVNATFIPFRDVIISDGLLVRYPVAFGRDVEQSLVDTYMQAKQNGQIHQTL